MIDQKSSSLWQVDLDKLVDVLPAAGRVDKQLRVGAILGDPGGQSEESYPWASEDVLKHSDWLLKKISVKNEGGNQFIIISSSTSYNSSGWHLESCAIFQ